MYNGIATKVITGEVRLSYVHLTQPYQSQQGGEPKYQVTMLIPKTDTATKADIDASMKAAYEDGVQNKWKGARPQLRNALIYDGDGMKNDGTPFGEECKGHWVMTASSPQSRKPQVVGVDNLNVELLPTDIYSGMYARVSINFFSYDSHGSKGVGCGLGNVMKTRDGEALSGGASAAQDFAGFGALSGGASAAQDFAGFGAPAGAVQPTGFGVPVTPTGAVQSAGFGVPTTPAINPITGLPM